MATTRVLQRAIERQGHINSAHGLNSRSVASDFHATCFSINNGLANSSVLLSCLGRAALSSTSKKTNSKGGQWPKIFEMTTHELEVRRAAERQRSPLLGISTRGSKQKMNSWSPEEVSREVISLRHLIQCRLTSSRAPWESQGRVA